MELTRKKGGEGRGGGVRKDIRFADFQSNLLNNTRNHYIIKVNHTRMIKIER